MQFSTRTTYGLRAMINLAKNSHACAGKRNTSVSLASIAKDEHISKKYLERLFMKLKSAGLVKSVKGAKGGYQLTKKPEQVSIYELVKILEGKVSPFYCLAENGKIDCRGQKKCGALKVLVKVQQVVNITLKQMKLSDLL